MLVARMGYLAHGFDPLSSYNTAVLLVRVRPHEDLTEACWTAERDQEDWKSVADKSSMSRLKPELAVNLLRSADPVTFADIRAASVALDPKRTGKPSQCTTWSEGWRTSLTRVLSILGYSILRDLSMV
jgi:hypothetical protein